MPRLIAYGLMLSGLVLSLPAVLRRWQWDDNNVLVGLVLDWHDIQAIDATTPIATLLARYKQHGATHVLLPELTLQRLATSQQISVTHTADQVYLHSADDTLLVWLADILAQRCPQLQMRHDAQESAIVVQGTLDAVAEVGLGCCADEIDFIQATGLTPVAYLMTPTADTLAMLFRRKVRLVMPAPSATLTPALIETMQHMGLTLAYVAPHHREVAHHLATSGLAIQAHAPMLPPMSEADFASYWTQQVVESGVRLCVIHYFPLIDTTAIALSYVQTLTKHLKTASFLPESLHTDISAYHPEPAPRRMIGVAVSLLGALGLLLDRLPLRQHLKLGLLALLALPVLRLPFVAPAQTLAALAQLIYPLATLTSRTELSLLESAVIGATGATTLSATTNTPDSILGTDETHLPATAHKYGAFLAGLGATLANLMPGHWLAPLAMGGASVGHIAIADSFRNKQQALSRLWGHHLSQWIRGLLIGGLLALVIRWVMRRVN